MEKTAEHSLRTFTIAVDVVVLTIEEATLKVLLIKRANEPFKDQTALPGAFIREKETAQDAIERVLQEKCGVELKSAYVEQLYTFDDPDRDPRGNTVSIVYYALINSSDLQPQISEFTQEPKLHSVEKLPQLAFDHNEVITYAVKRVRAKIEYTNLVYSTLPENFTMSQLQSAYETILGKHLDKRNFQKKFRSLNLIEPAGGRVEGSPNRPAQLFKFVKHSPVELERWF